MSILSNPINDQAVREGGLVRFITDNVWNHKKPYIGFTEDVGVKCLRNAGKNLLWKADAINIENDHLMLRKGRTMIAGQFDWKKYGITTISGHVVMFEEVYKALPETILADLIYFNDNIERLENMELFATQVKFTKFWIGSEGGFHNVHLCCETINFNDPPKVFENVTGKCGKIVFNCDDLADVPGLRYAVIKQTLNGKKIVALKDIRAYVNNPKKYPHVDPTIFFDIDKFIEASGLGNIQDLTTITIKDSGVRFDFNKPTDSWMCTHIEKL